MVLADLFGDNLFCMCSGLRKAKPPTSTTRAKADAGSAAPEPAPAKVLQCSLLFSSTNGGCFMLQWSDGPLPDDALATFVPTKPVPPYKLKNEGRSELIRDAGGPNARKFYEGWIAYIRTAVSFDGKLQLIKNMDFRPVALYCLDDTNSVRKHPFDAVLEFSGLLVVAIVPALSRDLDVIKMEPSLFTGAGERIGCTCEVGAEMSKRRSSAAPASPPKLPTPKEGASPEKEAPTPVAPPTTGGS